MRQNSDESSSRIASKHCPCSSQVITRLESAEHGQYVMLERLDDSNEFWKIGDELAKRYGLADPSAPWRGRTP